MDTCCNRLGCATVRAVYIKERRLTGYASEHGWLVLEIVSDSWKILNNLDTQAFKQLPGTDSRNLEKLWTTRCPSRDNNLLAGSN